MKIDHVHLYSNNVLELKDWFISKIGFTAIGRSINKHTHTELLGLNKIMVAISAPLAKASPVAQYLSIHPPGVVDIAFRVADLSATISQGLNLGCQLQHNIQSWRSPQGQFQFARISGWGDLQHTLIEAPDSLDYCWPQPIQLTPALSGPSTLLSHIDHVVLNVEPGQLESAVNFYQRLLGLQVSQNFQIHTNYSGLTSKALIDQHRLVQFNINQPSSSNSQIQEFLDRNNGSGIQHIALHTSDLITDITHMRRQGLEFLAISPSYYQNLKQHLDLNPDMLTQIAQQQILVDQDLTDAEALLMQIFTRPMFAQPTFFWEFIERRNGAMGFGQRNFTALFTAVERAQSARCLLT